MMIQTTAELSKLLKSTVLADSRIARLEIPESINYAMAIEVPRQTKFDCWEILRSLVNETHMYPVFSDFTFANTGKWYEDLVEEDFFSRFYYKEEQQAGYFDSVSPESIINVSNSIDGKKAIESRIKESERIADDIWRDSDWYLQDIEETKRNFAVSPSFDEAQAALNSGKIITEVDFERWLFNWELNNAPETQLSTAPDLSYQNWYENNSNDVLLLLPTPYSWDILAYIHFFGAINSAEAIAILKYWSDRYGAELVAAYGTMLHFYIKQKPKTLNESFELACQHNEFAPCTLILPGVSIREHARALLYLERWFLHERP